MQDVVLDFLFENAIIIIVFLVSMLSMSSLITFKVVKARTKVKVIEIRHSTADIYDAKIVNNTHIQYGKGKNKRKVLKKYKPVFIKLGAFTLARLFLVPQDMSENINPEVLNTLPKETRDDLLARISGALNDMEISNINPEDLIEVKDPQEKKKADEWATIFENEIIYQAYRGLADEMKRSLVEVLVTLLAGSAITFILLIMGGVI